MYEITSFIPTSFKGVKVYSIYFIKITKKRLAIISGGHTVDDSEPKYGLAVLGTVKPGAEISNANAKAGDFLVLTKSQQTTLYL